MTMLRTPVVALLAVVGACYAFLGWSTLLDLPGVTARWIAASGDPGFRFDSGLFLLLIASGSACVGLLGAATLAEAFTSLRRQDPLLGWGVLAVMVTLIHVPWSFYRLIATGRLPRPEAREALIAFGLRSALVIAVYILGWIVLRPKSLRGPAPFVERR